MASGLPLIVSDNRGTRGFVGSENGITCRYDDVEGFAEAIKTFASVDTRSMGQNNIRLSREFDSSIINQQMRLIYSETLNSPA